MPVVECASFGRSVAKYSLCKSDKNIELGKIFHMHEKTELPVKLDAKSLCSHTFITGSTGSGKSNAIYKILDKLPNETKFLVIEPAKGEYKNVFGGKLGVSVYGTNPTQSEILKINPFSFPKDTHILEHLDRLLEIFNLCWPMYAAMPAILKDAVEMAYKSVGWDLVSSTNEYGDDFYPNFSDVTRNIEMIMDGSEYSGELKANYKGSLLTRLQSLTNGINGLIFSADELSNEELFDKNVIVDLSRVGSSETKSLIMGILVLKLQEYRMSSGCMNADLKHITILEEAHNLLKRSGQGEGSNLIAKSVEMLTNAIAEMRTYGEGFVIADQAPALLDMAVIRNTNTKIIMRLPDISDRELVGKAANLSMDQISELARLPRGVAAVYQNEWIEPVLCEIDYFEAPNLKYVFENKNKKVKNYDERKALKIAKLLFNKEALCPEKLQEINSELNDMELDASTKVAINEVLKRGTTNSFKKVAPIVSNLFPRLRKTIKEAIKNSNSVDNWDKELERAMSSFDDLSLQMKYDIKYCIIVENIDKNYEKLKEWKEMQNGN